MLNANKSLIRETIKREIRNGSKLDLFPKFTGLESLMDVNWTELIEGASKAMPICTAAFSAALGIE
jgi:hypothetical protein